VAPVEEKLVQHRLRWFEHIQQSPAEAPICNGVIRQTGNEKGGRGRPNLTWEESVKRDLKDWCITKEPALDRRKWTLVIHVPELDLRFILFYCLFVKFLLSRPFLLF
jgi:hypothetical protein